MKTNEIAKTEHKDFARSIADLTSLREVLEDTHTSDVVEVVRCKECTEWDKDECECSRWYGFREDDYCSLGERMDGRM